MRTDRRLLALMGVALLTLAACGATVPPASTGTGPGASVGGQVQPAVGGPAAKAKVEAAARVTLVEQPGGDQDATVYANITTVATDGQFVAVIVTRDAATTKIVGDAMKTGFAAFGQLKTYIKNNVIVFYAAAGGTDNSAAVEAAVNSL